MRSNTRSTAYVKLGAFVALLVAAPAVHAQTGSIAGRVIDSQSGQTIAAAQVFIPELDIGALTQQNGSYVLPNVPAGTERSWSSASATANPHKPSRSSRVRRWRSSSASRHRRSRSTRSS